MELSSKSKIFVKKIFFAVPFAKLDWSIFNQHWEHADLCHEIVTSKSYQHIDQPPYNKFCNSFDVNN